MRIGVLGIGVVEVETVGVTVVRAGYNKMLSKLKSVIFIISSKCNINIGVILEEPYLNWKSR